MSGAPGAVRGSESPAAARAPRPAPPLVAVIAAYVLLFLGSGAAGGWLADTFAPGSWIAVAIGFFAWPMAFAASLQAWFGLGLLMAVPRVVALVWRTRTGRPAASQPSAATHRRDGAFVFLPISSAMGLLAGAIVGIFSPTHSIWFVTLIYWLTGTAHGALGWRLARAGVLMPPAEI